jgi:hypothetical protein
MWDIFEEGGSKLGPEPGYPDTDLSLFPLVAPGKCWNTRPTLIRTRHLAFTSFSIHHTQIIILLNATQPVKLKTSLNKRSIIFIFSTTQVCLRSLSSELFLGLFRNSAWATSHFIRLFVFTQQSPSRWMDLFYPNWGASTPAFHDMPNLDTESKESI